MRDVASGRRQSPSSCTADTVTSLALAGYWRDVLLICEKKQIIQQVRLTNNTHNDGPTIRESGRT